jgi:hypothetical protein
MARFEFLSLPFFGLGWSHGSFGQVLADRVEFILSVFGEGSKRKNYFCECLRAACSLRGPFSFGLG